ncbi:MAG TPA: cation:proton antiporter [Aurantimonas sp.]|nr:cation:proton antiporter [Aurantimonas sp.]
MIYDILIAGGGPAGLAFARALNGARLRIALIERQPADLLASPPVDGREIALTHRSVATLTRLGAWAQLRREDVSPLRKAQVLNGASSFPLAFDTAGTGEDRLGQLVPNHRIRQSLFRAVNDQSGLELITGLGVASVGTDRASARVTLTDGRVLDARLLVGADSRFSVIREQLGIAAEVNRLGRSMMVCRVAHEGDHQGIATEWFDHGQTIAMLPLRDRQSSAVLTLTSGEVERLAALSGTPLSVTHAEELFAVEAGGGILLGLVTGWLAYRAMRSIDEYNVEVMISLAVVMGGYALASALHVSGPVAMAVAGLIIGNHGVAHAMSDTTRDYLLKFWALIDDVLNAVLFLLIGLEVVTIPADSRLILLGMAAIPLVLAARSVAVVSPLLAIRPFLSLGRLAPVTLIWGGLRGGISVALALGLPEGPARSFALAATYIVVLFSVIVQGGTVERVIRWRSDRA